jgi:tRNA(Arg) A34 adenosine deaminase TadA
MNTTRRFLLCACGAAGLTASMPAALQARTALPSISMAEHERCMRLAIAEARGNPMYPFGAVIVRPSASGGAGETMARGVNDARENPILHGEIACMNDYLRRHGNKGWADMVLYTTGEPCSMCMSALVWAGIGGVVFASSVEGILAAGIDQIRITTRQVAEASPFYSGLLLGGVLAAETDKMFLERKR